VTIRITPLTVDLAMAFETMMSAEPAAYMASFTAFREPSSLVDAVANARRDKYWSGHLDRVLSGFYCLRGMDDGYDRPSFGVYVGREFAGRGVATTLLRHAVDWCATHGVERMMLKVSTDNPVAYGLYLKCGFTKVSMCDRTGHDILELSLDRPAAVSGPATINRP
jgi:RimJ/RimL family protein N-acetyltransferase